MAQFIMRKKLKELKVGDVIVRSFGLRAHGSPMNDKAKYALKKLKVPFSDFKSKPIPKNLASYDAVICMTAEHKEALKNKCSALYTFDELCGVGDVADPYGLTEKEYLEAAQTLDICLTKLAEYLYCGEKNDKKNLKRRKSL